MTSGAVTVDGSVLEGLARLLKPQGAFAEDLRAAGFDVQRPELRYSPAILRAVLDVCARYAFPGHSREEAHRLIGQRFVDHFFGTIPGRVAGTLLRIMGLKQFLLRLPKIAAMATTGLEIRPERLGPGELQITFKCPDMSPDFTTGTIEGAAHAGRFPLRAEIVRRGVGEFELLVSVTR